MKISVISIGNKIIDTLNTTMIFAYIHTGGNDTF